VRRPQRIAILATSQDVVPGEDRFLDIDLRRTSFPKLITADLLEDATARRCFAARRPDPTPARDPDLLGR
jgi:hypothetical protein